MAADLVDSKSTTSYIIHVYGNPIVWKSTKQKVVSKSSTFAEYYALSDCIDEMLYVKHILIDVGPAKSLNIIPTNEDNNGTIAIAKYSNFYFAKKSQHIRVAIHSVTDLIKKNVIDVRKIDTSENVADVFTKALGRIKFV